MLQDKELASKTSWDSVALTDPSVKVGQVAGPAELLDKVLKEMFKYSSDAPGALPVLVGYGTEYGYSKELAQLLCEMLSENPEE